MRRRSDKGFDPPRKGCRLVSSDQRKLMKEQLQKQFSAISNNSNGSGNCSIRKSSKWDEQQRNPPNIWCVPEGISGIYSLGQESPFEFASYCNGLSCDIQATPREIYRIWGSNQGEEGAGRKRH